MIRLYLILIWKRIKKINWYSLLFWRRYCSHCGSKNTHKKCVGERIDPNTGDLIQNFEIYCLECKTKISVTAVFPACVRRYL